MKGKNYKKQNSKPGQVEECKICKNPNSEEHKDLWMKYSCLNELDITVQCQIDVFRWLVRYINPNWESLSLDFKNVSSVLVSADSLVMDDLVEECLKFIKSHLPDIVKFNENIPPYKSHLAKRLASIITIDELENLGNKKNYLVSRLFKK